MLTLVRAHIVQRHIQIRCAPTRFITSGTNKKTDHQPVKVSEQNVIQVKESVTINPVRQELIKRIPVEFHGVEASRFDDHSEWYPIFRSPYANAMRVVIKFKVYLTAFSLISSVVYASQVMLGASANPWKAAILSTLSLVGLTFIGDFARRLIVQIYVSPDQQYVRFCRFSFFGRRRDMVLPKECIVRLTEINPTQRAPMLKVEFTMPERGINIDHDHYEFYELGFRIPIGLGGVLDTDKFNSMLGKILVKKPLNH